MFEKKLEVYNVCEKDEKGALPLYEHIDGEEICLYVKKASYAGDEKIEDLKKKYFISSSEHFFEIGEPDNDLTEEKDYHIKPENLVCDADGKTVLGYVFHGRYLCKTCNNKGKYTKKIFLPLNEEARHTYLSIENLDCTPTEYRCDRYTQIYAAGSKKIEIYTVCDKDTEGAVALYQDIGKKAKICRYVKKARYAGDEILKECYLLRKSDTSGGGDGFGGASQNKSSNETDCYIEPENIVCGADCKTVLGYVYRGKYSYYSNGDNDGYLRDIFLPLGGSARYTDYEYSYTVYPYDGTSSSYSKTQYMQLIKK